MLALETHILKHSWLISMQTSHAFPNFVRVSDLSVAQLEAALGVFYAPPVPLSDTVILEYREPISKYARRFFHHLLR